MKEIEDLGLEPILIPPLLSEPHFPGSLSFWSGAPPSSSHTFVIGGARLCYYPPPQLSYLVCKLHCSLSRLKQQGYEKTVMQATFMTWTYMHVPWWYYEGHWNWGYKAESFNSHSFSWSSFLFNSLCSGSHSNSIPSNWDSIHNNSRQLCHSLSILHNYIKFH